MLNKVVLRVNSKVPKEDTSQEVINLKRWQRADPVENLKKEKAEAVRLNLEELVNQEFDLKEGKKEKM